jgi:hypothetical protein
VVDCHLDENHDVSAMRASLVVMIAIFSSLGAAPALAEMKALTYNTRFCPSWAEAHEHSLASLNKGRPLYPRWKGCIVLKWGTRIDIVDEQDDSTEIVVRGKHWITDEHL